MKKSVFLVILSLFWTGCQYFVEPEEARTTNLPPVTFQAEVEGYITRAIQGEAVFETLYGLGNEPYFWLRLSKVEDRDGDRSYQIIDFVAKRKNPLEIGEYEFSIIEQGREIKSGDLSASYDDSEVNGSSFKSTGGTLQILASDDDTLEGIFTFTAYDDVQSAPGESERVEIEVSGKFHAADGHVGVILN